MKRYRYAVKPDGLAVADRLRRPGEIFAVAKPHQIQGFGCRQHCLVAGPGVVRMRMGGERSGDRADRIDVEGSIHKREGCGRPKSVNPAFCDIERHSAASSNRC
jgi:hypothetical protein